MTGGEYTAAVVKVRTGDIGGSMSLVDFCFVGFGWRSQLKNFNGTEFAIVTMARHSL